MVKTPRPDSKQVGVHRAAADVERASRALSRARRRLASVTKPGAPHAVFAPAFRPIEELLRTRQTALSRIPNITGYGAGYAMKDGNLTDEPALTLFVETKRSLEDLARAGVRPLPKAMKHKGKRVRIDVVEMGPLQRLAFAGQSLGPEGTIIEGSIGAFARDLANDSTVAITAMHVTGGIGLPPQPLVFDAPSQRTGSPVVRRLGVLTGGTLHAVDAAKIQLDNSGDAFPSIPGIGPIAGWRTLAIPGDQGIGVSLFGAGGRKLCSGRIVYPSISLPNDGLIGAIAASIETHEGDSGTALVDADRHVLGFLVGRANVSPVAGMAIFSSAALTVSALQCDF